MIGLNIKATAILAATLVGFGGSQAVEHGTQLVRPGTPTIFEHASELSRDCSELDVPKIEVLKPPKHGRIHIFRAKLYPDGFRSDNPRYKCRKMKVRGTQAQYTPDRGYYGEDSVTIRIHYLYGDGEIRQNSNLDIKTDFIVGGRPKHGGFVKR
jgi:hypothetical protein